MSTVQLLKKIISLEQEIALLKLSAYKSLSKSARRSLLYPESSILRAAKLTREERWRERYASKVARVR